MTKRVLILCTGNSARSQMAEGFFRKLGGADYEVHSAGIYPSTVNPLAIEAMREIGIDISGHRSKSVDEFAGQSFDTVITVCDFAAEHCPIFPGSPQRMHWNLPDPAAVGSHDQKLAGFRSIRDELASLIRKFLAKQ
ncbi:MAG TPA: arsenate reductase ArsC [Candidatus Acidoferrum sp.]|nr:arsenate reductase ArsC [Candidatus Acidoferrum sp.]